MSPQESESERRGKWFVGQKIPLTEDKDGSTYTIVGFIGTAGTMQISERGTYYVHWQREKPDGKIVFVRHGGEEGFATLQDVRAQIRRVIVGYTGITVQLPLEAGEVPVEEKREGIPIAGFTIPEMVREFRTLELPGEQKRLNKMINTLQDSNRDLPAVKVTGQLSGIRQKLREVKRELGGSINRHKRDAAASLEEGLTGSEGDLLSAVNKAQIDLLKRSQQTVSILIGTMQRYTDAENKQREWNSIVENLPGSLGSVLKVFQTPSFIDGARLERVVRHEILDEKIGIEVKLQELKGQPYLKDAQKFIDPFARLKELAKAGSYLVMIPILEKQILELRFWAERNRDENSIESFGRYDLGRSKS